MKGIEGRLAKLEADQVDNAELLEIEPAMRYAALRNVMRMCAREGFDQETTNEFLEVYGPEEWLPVHVTKVLETKDGFFRLGITHQDLAHEMLSCGISTQMSKRLRDPSDPIPARMRAKIVDSSGIHDAPERQKFSSWESRHGGPEHG